MKKQLILTLGMVCCVLAGTSAQGIQNRETIVDNLIGKQTILTVPQFEKEPGVSVSVSDQSTMKGNAGLYKSVRQPKQITQKPVVRPDQETISQRMPVFTPDSLPDMLVSNPLDSTTHYFILQRQPVR